MNTLYSSISCNLDSHVLQAALPLFATEKVQAIEWSFDTLFKTPDIPPWFVELLLAFGQEKRLIGHGVFFSLFSGQWSQDQVQWLDRLKRMSRTFQFDHVTEHFGFMTGKDFHKGAPLGIPFNATTLAIGQDRLKRIYDACACPVGLENLAFSYTLEEVKRHGAFLEQLLAPLNGFIILDLHNLYCQLHNFELQLEDLLPLYPLDRVREIHISGGSWEDSTILPQKKIRRDTHDDRVPEMIFQLLEKTIPQCPNLKYVVLEQIGTGLYTQESKINFRKDFIKMDKIVQNQNKRTTPTNAFLPLSPIELEPNAVEDALLQQQQITLSQILETAINLEDAQVQIEQSCLANSDWKIEQWEPFMLETAIQIAQKWKQGFE